MGITFRLGGRILQIFGVGGSLFEFFMFFLNGQRPVLGLWFGLSIMIGFLFIAFGEIINLLEQNLKQNQDLYKLIESRGGESE